MQNALQEQSERSHSLLIRSGEKRETIDPASKTEWLKLRTKDITSTEVPALFGISPYVTHFELWHRKKSGEIVEHSGNERTEWGKRLEASIAHGVAETYGFEIRPMTEYIRDPESRIGSSFDYAIEAKEVDGEIIHMAGILEIKNVDALQFKDGWIVGDNGEIEAPPHIEMQVQHQLLVSNRDVAYIGALVGGNTLKLLKRNRNENVIEAIKKKIAQFWESIDLNKEPVPNFERDADFIAKLYSHSTKDTAMTADQRLTDLAEKYKVASDQEAIAVKHKKSIKAEILTIIGKYEKVKGELFTISASETPSKWIERFERAGYRNFRISWRKKK